MTPEPSTLSRPALEALCAAQAATIAELSARLERITEMVDDFMAAGPWVETPQKGIVYDIAEEIAVDRTSEGNTQRGEGDRRAVRGRSAAGIVHAGPDGHRRESVQGVRRIHDDSGISEEEGAEVIATLRALGCDLYEARRLAGVCQGETTEQRIKDALARRG